MSYKEEKDPLTGKGKRHEASATGEYISSFNKIISWDDIHKLEMELEEELKGVKTVRQKFTRAQAKSIGDELGVNWKEFSLNEFYMGVNVELEHGKHDPETNVSNDDPLITGKIALAHLKEIRDYYTKLKIMEG